MTKKELIQVLANFPDDANVMVFSDDREIMLDVEAVGECVVPKPTAVIYMENYDSL